MKLMIASLLALTAALGSGLTRAETPWECVADYVPKIQCETDACLEALFRAYRNLMANSMCSALEAVVQQYPECFDLSRERLPVADNMVCSQRLANVENRFQSYQKISDEVRHYWRPQRSSLCRAEHLNLIYEQQLIQEPFGQAMLTGALSSAMELSRDKEPAQRQHILVRTSGHGHEEHILSKLFQPSRYTFALTDDENAAAIAAFQRFQKGRTGKGATVDYLFSAHGNYQPEDSVNMVVMLPDMDDAQWMYDVVNMMNSSATELVLFLKHQGPAFALIHYLHEHTEGWRLQLATSNPDTDTSPFPPQQLFPYARPFPAVAPGQPSNTSPVPRTYQSVLYFKRQVVLVPGNTSSRKRPLGAAVLM